MEYTEDRIAAIQIYMVAKAFELKLEKYSLEELTLLKVLIEGCPHNPNSILSPRSIVLDLQEKKIKKLR